LAVIPAFNKRHVDALKGKIAERSDTIDATADDEYLGRGPLLQCNDGVALCVL
jgi:hypothetical protein